MDWKTFRALETFAVVFDIQIDEEEYHQGPCHFEREEGLRAALESLLRQPLNRVNGNRQPPWERLRVYPKPLDGADSVTGLIKAIRVDDELLASRIPSWKPKTSDFSDKALPSWDGIGTEWQCLLAAKLVRAELMALCATKADEALDPVADGLGRHLPVLPEFITSGMSSDRGTASPDEEQVQQVLLRLLYLLELSACCHDQRTIAYADTALKLLTRCLSSLGLQAKDCEGQSPYELVGLYNMALGRMHTGAFSEAAKLFSDVARYAGMPSPEPKPSGTKPVHYFDAPDAGAMGQELLKVLRWQGQDARLFQCYVGSRSGLMCAEALNKQQRSWEGLQWLQPLAGVGQVSLTPYQDHRRALLEFRLRSDRKEKGQSPSLPQNLQYTIRLKRQTDASALEATEGIFRRKRLESLKSRAEIAREDRTEFDQVLLEWARGWEGLHKCLMRVEKRPKCAPGLLRRAEEYLRAELPDGAKWTGTDSFCDAVVDLISDGLYRDHRPETRVLVFDGVWAAYRVARHMCRAGYLPEEWVDELRRGVAKVAEAVVKSSETAELDRVPLHLRHQAQSRLRLAGKQHLPLLANFSSGKDAESELQGFIGHCLTKGWLDPGTAQGQASGEGSPAETVGKLVPECIVCPRSPSWASVENPCERLKSFAAEPGSPLQGIRREQGGSGLQHYWDRVIESNFRAIHDHLKKTICPSTPSGWGFAVLQRWNSFTPAMAVSEGGGYLVFRVPLDPEPTSDHGRKDGHFGLAVDPGYGFVKNLLVEDYALSQLTAVAVTHDHPDHVADFEALHTLLVEYHKIRTKQDLWKPIDVLVTEGALRHLSPCIESSKEILRDVVVLSSCGPAGVATNRYSWKEGRRELVKIEAVPAIHKDLSSFRSDPCDSVGLIVTLLWNGDRAPEREEATIGIPSDTAWCKGTARRLKKCDVVCLHLGSVTGRNRRFLDLLNQNELDDVLESAMHLYLPGVFWFLKEISESEELGRGPRLVVLTETGEELRRGLRVDLARALDRWFTQQDPTQSKVKVVPGDVGLLADPFYRTMRCSCCGGFYPWETEFEYESFGEAEQIFYVCPNCRRSLSYNQRASIYRRKQAPLIQRLLDQL